MNNHFIPYRIDSIHSHSHSHSLFDSRSPAQSVLIAMSHVHTYIACNPMYACRMHIAYMCVCVCVVFWMYLYFFFVFFFTFNAAHIFIECFFFFSHLLGLLVFLYTMYCAHARKYLKTVSQPFCLVCNDEKSVACFSHDFLRLTNTLLHYHHYHHTIYL